MAALETEAGPVPVEITNPTLPAEPKVSPVAITSSRVAISCKFPIPETLAYDTL